MKFDMAFLIKCGIAFIIRLRDVLILKEKVFAENTLLTNICSIREDDSSVTAVMYLSDPNT